MKKVLIVSYYFPPLGLSGVQRAAKFAKYLPDYGWEPVILTVKDIYYYHKDQSLIDDISRCEVIRTASLDPLRLKWLFQWRKKDKPSGHTIPDSTASKINRFIFPWIFIPDTKFPWIPFALFKALRIVQTRKIDAILTTSPPHSSQFIGYLLNRIFGIPWIADFRDSWLNESYDPNPTMLHRAVNQWMKRQIVCRADFVTAVSKHILSHLTSGVLKKKACLIYNGYDPDDYKGKSQSKPNRKLTITYCGTLNHVLHPGLFFQGLEDCLAQNPDIRKEIRVVFAGSVYDISIEKEIRRYGLENIVEWLGYQEHPVSIGYLFSADALLFFLPPNAGPGVITGKLFEYMAASKPIMALVPAGEAADMICKYQKIRPVYPEDIQSVSGLIQSFFKLWQKDELKQTVHKMPEKVYSRAVQSKQLANLLHITQSDKNILD